MKLTDADRTTFSGIAEKATCTPHVESLLRDFIAERAYIAGMKAMAEKCALIADKEAIEIQSRIDSGKGIWPGPDYVTDEQWARWFARREAMLVFSYACRALAKEGE